MDPYEILGVSKSASPDEIKRAYLRLAKSLHPDVNSAADAVQKFQAVQLAYDQLTGKAKYTAGTAKTTQPSTPSRPSSFNDYMPPTPNWDFLFDELRKTTDQMGSMRTPSFPDPVSHLYEQAARGFDSRFNASAYTRREPDPQQRRQMEEIRAAGRDKAIKHRNSVRAPIEEVWREASVKRRKVNDDAQAKIEQICREAKERNPSLLFPALNDPVVRQQIRDINQVASDEIRRISDHAAAHAQNMLDSAESFARYAMEEAERQAQAVLSQ